MQPVQQKQEERHETAGWARFRTDFYDLRYRNPKEFRDETEFHRWLDEEHV